MNIYNKKINGMPLKIE